MVLPPPQTREFTEHVAQLEQECIREHEQLHQSLQEIVLLLQKTNSEVEKLAARELQLSNRVRDMEMHLDNYGREDIRDLYSSSHEVQLRLFMMRSQAEQLQSRQQHIREHQEKINLLLDLLQAHRLYQGADITAPLAPRQSAILGGTSTFTAMLGNTQTLSAPNVMNLIEAQEDERLRISRQIHDGPTQTLINVVLRAEICERLLDRDVAEARAELNGLKAMISASLQETRRIIFDLRPMILDDLGLVPTLRRYLAELGRIKQLRGEVAGPEHDLDLNSTMQTALFRFTQMILAAMLADGGAEHVDIRVERDDSTARIFIDAAALQGDRTAIEERLEEDLHLTQRLEMLNGALTTEQRSNRGFLVEVVIPIPLEAAA